MKLKTLFIAVCAVLLLFSCSKSNSTDPETILPDKDGIQEEPDEEELPDAVVSDGNTEIPDKEPEPEPEP